ncbi:MAG: type IV pilus biogenesis protein PilM [bacterium]
METITSAINHDSPAKTKPKPLSQKALQWTFELLPKSRKFVGIEFDRNLIKFILVDKRGVKNGVRLLKVKFLSSNHDDEILKVLRDHLQEMHLAPNQPVTISIPRHSVHTKILRLPSHDLKELRKMAMHQLQNDLPLPFQEIVFDISLIARENDGYARVMVVIARKRDIKRYQKLCKNAGLTVEAIRLNIEAIYQSFLRLGKEMPEIKSKCVALVDVDFSATNVIIIDSGKLLFCRSVGRGVEDLMERMVGVERHAEYDSWMDELSKGVAETNALFEANGVDARVEFVALTGWLPRVQALTRILQENLKVPVKWFDLMIPLGHFPQTDSDTIMQHWFSISTLLGMACSRDQNLMDLRLSGAQQNHKRRIIFRKSVYTSLLIFYILAVLTGTTKVALKKRQKVLLNLKHQIELLQPQVQAVNKSQQVQQLLQSQLGSTETTSAIIAQLLAKLPAGVELSSLTFLRGERLVVRGVAGKLADVFNLPNLLTSQLSFSEAVIASADRRKRSGKKEEIEFEVKITLSQNSQPDSP